MAIDTNRQQQIDRAFQKLLDQAGLRDIPNDLTISVSTVGDQSFAGVKSFADGIKANRIDAYSASVLAMMGAPTDGATAVGTAVGSSGTLANAGAKVLQVKNNTTEIFNLDKDGTVRLSPTLSGGVIWFNPTGSTYVAGSTLYLYVKGPNGILFSDGVFGNAARTDGAGFFHGAGSSYSSNDNFVKVLAAGPDGAGAVGLVVDTASAWSNAGAKLATIKTNNVERACVWANGSVEVTTIGAGFILKSPDGTRYRIQVANGGALSTTPV